MAVHRLEPIRSAAIRRADQSAGGDSGDPIPDKHGRSEMSDNTDFGTFGRFAETPVSEMPEEMKQAYDYTLKLPGPDKLLRPSRGNGRPFGPLLSSHVRE
jgi:hypothetical protein